MNIDSERPDAVSDNVVSASDADTKPKRLIGSQRNPDAYRPEPTIPVVDESAKSQTEELKTETYPPEGVDIPAKPETAPIETDLEDEELLDHLSEEGEQKLRNIPAPAVHRITVPKLRGGRLSDDLEEEFNAVFGNQSLETLLEKSGNSVDEEILESDTKLKAKVLSIQGDSVFLDLGVREQGVVSLKLFPPEEEPKVGDQLDVTVIRFLPDEGLYDVSVPLAAADVRDWSQVREGMVVEAKITKTNTGGLECEVNRLRGFIPISQIELFRVEDTEQYVGQKLTCIVEEVDPERRNLVLSRRALLNREREEKRERLLDELEPGQIREGLIRKIIDAGAFVDLGGIDGFIPIGAIAWGRINHPGEVLSEGSRVKVRIARIEEGTNRISLVYRDEASNPWSNISERFQEKSVARGKVTKLMDFGAFVELMPGVEGLIHISELSSKRIGHPREVVKEGDWTDVYIVSIDPQAKRMGLSIKQLAVEQASISEDEAEESDRAEGETDSGKGKKGKETGVAVPVKVKQKPKGPLKGGTEGDGGGAKFGLKW